MNNKGWEAPLQELVQDDTGKVTQEIQCQVMNLVFPGGQGKTTEGFWLTQD